MSEKIKSTDLQPIHLEFVNRLMAFTLIHQILTIADQSYERIKTSNSLINSTFDHVESLAKNFAKPMLHTFEKPIHVADNLACQSLDRLQSSVRSVSDRIGVDQMQKRMGITVDYVQNNMKQIQKMIDQSMNQTRTMIEMFRKQTSQHVHSMMNMSETFIRSIDNSLNAAENLLDRLLPASNNDSDPSPNESSQSDETSKINDPQQPLKHLFQRMVRFSDKLRRRSWQHLEKKYLILIQQHVQNVWQNTWAMASQSTAKLSTVDNAAGRQKLINRILKSLIFDN
ncbi:perilipin-like protein [Sarcoptes scabiei]|uniref:Perilipin-like protein n=1 Tax=Sarcoptes scabiei TaxID=52283 RepID=A0A132A110_SARSC|nr:perilipin-like protein [Sarcoptes scabiei]